jgi:hypothetical protein
VVLNRFAVAEVIQLEHLADLDLALSSLWGLGQRLIHSIASSFELHCSSQ